MRDVAETKIPFRRGKVLLRKRPGVVFAQLNGMSIQSYRDLRVWQIGMEFVISIYVITKKFPREERYGLTSQLRRASVAIPSNVSEGQQQGTKAYLHFVTMAIGSLAEAETQVEIARRLHLVSEDEHAPINSMATDLRRALHGLRRSLVARSRAKANLNPDP